MADRRPRKGSSLALGVSLVRAPLRGIVSKRLGSPYRSGRVNDWLKIKKPGGAGGEARGGGRLGRQAAPQLVVLEAWKLVTFAHGTQDFQNPLRKL